MTVDVLTPTQENQVNEMFTKLSRMLADWRREHGAKFAGIVHISIPDAQLLADYTEWREATKYQRTPKRRKIGTGDQSRYMGVRVVAHGRIALGCIEFDQQ